MTSDDCCYYGACGTCAVSTSPNSSDGLSNISELLLVPSTVSTGYTTSDDHYYCWACGTRVVATIPHSSDERSDNSGPLLLPPTVVMGKQSIATGLPVAMGYLISAVRRY
jgi:hypothetical protein